MAYLSAGPDTVSALVVGAKVDKRLQLDRSRPARGRSVRISAQDDVPVVASSVLRRKLRRCWAIGRPLPLDSYELWALP
jgi:hypothetical protein